MDYLNYKVEDFIADESFQRYCLNRDENDVRFWNKWKTDHPHKQYEIEEAEHFIRSMELRLSSRNNFDYRLRKQAIREELQNKIKRQNKQIKKTTWFLLAASIALFICVSAAIVYIKKDESIARDAIVSYSEKVNRAGLRSRIQLADGTIVHLNTQSKLRYPNSFNDLKTREVELDGEAYFEVKHDESKPFIVHSGNLKTTVLGTSFNVRAYSGRPMAVALVEGKVVVAKYAENSQQIFLTPGQGATLSSHDGEISTFEFDRKEFLSWKDGVLYFNNATEGEVIDRLKSWYGVSITRLNASAKKWGYTGEFKNKSLKEVLMSMSFAMDFDYTIKDDSVLIKHHKAK